MARYCRNSRIRDRIGEDRILVYRNRNNGQRRAIKEGNRQNNNLNGDQDLIILDYVSVIWRRRQRNGQSSRTSNRYTILSRVIDNISCYDLNNGDMLREVIVKIGLERIDM